jgi:deoxyguanosine kinase
MLRIEICGGIASGKTTLARLLTAANLHVVFESYRLNPFWTKFYLAPEKYAFETELAFLLQHYHGVKEAALGFAGPTVCDYSFVLDRAYVDVTLTSTQREAFLAVYNQIVMEVGPPALVINLTCSPTEELARIKRRSRSVETSVQLDFLACLNNSISEHIVQCRRVHSVLDIDSENQNFAADKAVQERILRNLMFYIEQLRT